MYEMTSKPLVRRTLATLRSAELGFLGVVVYTRVHTPRRCGQFSRAGDLLLSWLTTGGLRTSWLIVGMNLFRNRLGLRKQPGQTPATTITTRPCRLAQEAGTETESAGRMHGPHDRAA